MYAPGGPGGVVTPVHGRPAGLGRSIRILIAVALAGTSCVLGDSRAPPEQEAPARSLARNQRVACSLPAVERGRLLHGFHPDRSGDLQMLLRQPNAFAYAHAEPADHLQEVPVLLYGPGHVPAAGRLGRPVTMADVAPTLAEYLRFDFAAPDGRPMRAALPAPGRRGDRPRLILVIVWDGAGRNVLAEWPRAWPTARSLIDRGAWFDRATLGTAPSVTPPIHTTLGTGAFPDHHGLVDIFIREDGAVEPSHATPEYLLVPSLADVYDRAEGNRPVVGVVASRDWHLGMVGHGSFLEGGDRDVAVLLDERKGVWALQGENARYFRFPPYVNEVGGLDEAVHEIDLEDGALNQRWRGEDLTDPTSLRRTPAFARWQTNVIREVIRREGFGADDVPDLLFTNYKQIDEVGHRWTMNSAQMEAAVRSSDDALADLLAILDRQVGRGQWVVALTADHGVVPSRDLTGGFNVNKERFEADIEETFGKGAVQQFRPTQLWLDQEVLDEGGFTVAQVAAFVMAYTKGENAADDAELSESEASDRLFRAAFPSEVLEDLPCAPGSG